MCEGGPAGGGAGQGRAPAGAMSRAVAGGGSEAGEGSLRRLEGPLHHLDLAGQDGNHVEAEGAGVDGALVL